MADQAAAAQSPCPSDEDKEIEPIPQNDGTTKALCLGPQDENVAMEPGECDAQMAAKLESLWKRCCDLNKEVMELYFEYHARLILRALARYKEDDEGANERKELRRLLKRALRKLAKNKAQVHIYFH
ncbi:hypothetical protein KR093_005993 [Drosophila rubida]|uniref:Uncharacterized protein n=1 Tax=Drosophila rubida TaxID=30044 RepID=A0AAD4JXA9_9MUSC|nr:hypothetical protein KR093_005993 [Drosophila rubida]